MSSSIDDRSRNITSNRHLLAIFNFGLCICGTSLTVSAYYCYVMLDEVKPFMGSRLNHLALIIMWSSLFILIAIIIGCYAGLRVRIKWCFVYLITMGLCGMLQFGIGMAALRTKLQADARLLNYLEKDFMEYDKNDETASRWNHFQKKFKCCGVQGPQDYTTYKFALPSECCEIENCFMFPGIEQQAFLRGCIYELVAIEGKGLTVMGLFALVTAVLQLSGSAYTMCALRHHDGSQEQNSRRAFLD